MVLLGYFCALQYAHLLGSAPANARELGSDDVDFAGREVLAAALAILGQCAAPPGMHGHGADGPDLMQRLRHQKAEAAYTLLHLAKRTEFWRVIRICEHCASVFSDS